MWASERLYSYAAWKMVHLGRSMCSLAGIRAEMTAWSIPGAVHARFEDQVALVTGAGGGIGQAVAARLVAEGATVVIADVSQPALARAREAFQSAGRISAVVTDATDPDAVDRLVQIVASKGRIDVLVNAAGVLRSTPADAIALSEWDYVLRSNLTSAFLCARAVHASMVAAGYGRIVNVASMAGRATSTLGGAHYTTAKAGLLGLTRHLAREWTRFGITVNAVSPGIVDTSMVRSAASEDRLREVESTIPAGRFAQPAEIASLICFLASPEAAYITGANVDIHGGELIIA